jgi:hypothetical protein
MKKSDKKFEWTEEVDQAFSHLKKLLSTPPVLVAPKDKEPLLQYIAATHQVVSTVLVVERSEEGENSRSSTTCILLERSTFTIQATVPALSETGLQRLHDSKKTPTLFCGPPSNSGQ